MPSLVCVSLFLLFRFYNYRYHSKVEKLTSEVFFYKRGANQQFIQPEHIFNPSTIPQEDLSYSVEKDVIPIVIQCVALEGPDGELN